MPWLPLLSYFFGGAFLANAVPHFVSGMMGRPFQSPFVKPSEEGLSSSTVNVLWGFFNIEPPRVYRRLICSNIRRPYRVYSVLHRTPPRLLRVGYIRWVRAGGGYYTNQPI